MIFATYRECVQILAETEADADILRQLVRNLPQEAPSRLSYLQGSFYALDLDDPVVLEKMDFSQEEINRAKMAVEFMR